MLILLSVLLGLSMALFTYLRLEPKGTRSWLPLISRATAWAGLGALLVNPSCLGRADSRPPLVLLDASLSMTSEPGLWKLATDTAHSLGEVRWFGDARPWTDSAPDRGRSELAPTLTAASAVGRRIVVVTDGELDDAKEIPSELLASAGMVVLPRSHGRDLAVTRVTAPARVTVGDTLSIFADIRLTGADTADSAAVGVMLGTRVLGRATTKVTAGATVAARIPIGTRGLSAGVQFLRVGVLDARDTEPRNDARLVAVEFGATPGIVMLASLGDWDARFLFRTLREVAGLPVKGYVELESDRWWDMDGPHDVATSAVRAAANRADLLVVRGLAPGMAEAMSARGILRWPGTGGIGGEWYVSSAPMSPVAFAFLGVPLDSLPPVTGAQVLVPTEGDWVGLSVQMARRGTVRPVLVGRQIGHRREITVGAEGLWRWAFRGGPSADVYRTMVAASVSWLLGAPDRGSVVARVARPVVEQGMPLTFERTSDSFATAPILFESDGVTRHDTLRFGGDGQATTWLPPGTYRYRFSGPPGGSGLVAVDTWSREWLMQPASVASRTTAAVGVSERRSARQLPWLYALVLCALAGEWLARRRLGLR